MIYIKFNYFLFVILLMAVYYVLPLSKRWIALLVGSIGFYYVVCPKAFIVFVGSITISYLCSYLVRKSKILLFLSVVVSVLPLAVTKIDFDVPVLVPLGLSFYTLQTIAYLVDVRKGKVEQQKNFFKYALFISFFPQIVQGPIPRYEQLGKQLFDGNKFNERTAAKAFGLIIWGFFLKLMIADKAGVIVDTLFVRPDMYGGVYVVVAGVLYSVQLYTDFLACVTISRGVAALFGITLVNNFNHPYFATSIKDFWRRWHISLSSWLRDYVYIPLGGNRKGKIVKYLNLIITFAVSGVWHGTGLQFLVWGLLHAVYQIVGECTAPIREKIYAILKMPKDSLIRKIISTGVTFFLVMLAWIIFRAKDLETGLDMIRSLFTVFNPWILSGNALFMLGLSMKESFILLLAILLLVKVSRTQGKRNISEWIMEQHIVLRFAIYIGAICCIWIFGTYGYGYSVREFIYGGF